MYAKLLTLTNDRTIVIGVGALRLHETERDIMSAVTHKGKGYDIVAVDSTELAGASAMLAANASVGFRSNRSNVERQTAILVAILTALHATRGPVAVQLPSFPVGNSPTMNLARRAVKALLDDDTLGQVLAVATRDEDGGKTNSTCTTGTGWVLRD